MQANILNLYILMALLFPSAHTAYSLTHSTGLLLDLIQPGFGHQQRLAIHHHMLSNPLKNPFYQSGFYLSEGNFQSRLLKHLYQEGLPQEFSLLEIEGSGLFSPEGISIRRYLFRHGDIPLCRYELKTWFYSDGSLPSLAGQFPATAPDLAVPTGDWPDKSEAFAMVRSLPEFADGPGKILRARKCLYDTDTEWPPSWELLFEVDGLPYQAYADHLSVFKTERKFFTATGTLQFYAKNPVDANLQTQTFDLTGDGYLTTTEVTTKVQEKSGRAYSEDLNFVQEPEHVDFGEINAFAHVLRIISWFKNLGFEWTKDEVLTLRVHHNSLESIRYNNGLYLPPEYKGDDAPSITLGDGDGTVLQNLALDRDVVSHEFGHHVIYRHLKSTSQTETRGEEVETGTDHSGSIHEALADYYIFAMTEDSSACLGESICPGGTHDICYQRGKCLRTATQSLTYDSDEYWDFGRLFHLKSQVISGMLWEIRQDPETDSDLFDRLVLESVPFLKTASTYRDLLIALFSSDQKYYSGRFGCTIESYAKSRGFVGLLAGLNTGCSVTSSPKIATREKKCGAIPAPHPDTHSSLWLLLLALLPLLTAFRLGLTKK